ncbi:MULTISPECIES: DciA family protein [unclassified Streptomyces]|uniref:DciA family protein n=1 Tax=unclassified Streptomyces TaxID=2593676 RepID=UPI002E3329F0|nr:MULTISPECIES: DciA family protein [unclassified Streptomyces]WUC69229.1 DciA family protein [Streptomyces sp. NBC_00539]
MSQSAEPSGVDLARVALRAAREAAKKTGARTAKNKPRLTRTVRRDGRAPMGLGEAFTALMAERGWETPTAGAGLCERWAVLAPDLAEHVAAVGYDAERGELTLRPDSTAWATKARLEASRIITDANRSARTDAVCTVRVLSPGPLPAPIAAAEPVPGSAPVVQGPVRTRETATAGYRRALEAHQQAHTQRQPDPATAAAVGRQNRVLREASRHAFPEPEAVRVDQPAPVDAVLVQRRRDAEAVRLRALHRARAERAGLAQLPAQVPRATYSLDQTG